MSPRAFCPLGLALILACGGSGGGTTRILTLATTYDALGVARTLADGVTPTEMNEVYFRIDGVSTSGGRVSGSVAPNGGPGAFEFDGRFDEDGMLTMPIGEAPLTSTIAETVDELGGVAEDTKPTDGVADEINGYIRTRFGLSIHDGSFLAVARQSARPDPIDESKVTLESTELAEVRIQGSAGAVMGLAGVEVFRFRLRDTTPEFSLYQAREDGSFDLRVTAIQEDVFLLRARVVGKASDARFFRVAR